MTRPPDSVDPTAALSATGRRWAWRIAIAVTILSLVGYFSDPVVSPLMCKIYG